MSQRYYTRSHIHTHIENADCREWDIGQNLFTQAVFSLWKPFYIVHLTLFTMIYVRMLTLTHTHIHTNKSLFIIERVSSLQANVRVCVRSLSTRTNHSNLHKKRCNVLHPIFKRGNSIALLRIRLRNKTQSFTFRFYSETSIAGLFLQNKRMRVVFIQENSFNFRSVLLFRINSRKCVNFERYSKGINCSFI